MAGAINYDEVRKARENKKKRRFQLGSKKINKLESKAHYRSAFSKHKRGGGGKTKHLPKRWLSVYDPVMKVHKKVN